MLIKLVREARIRHKPGEIVEVSPGEAQFLLSIGSAVPAPATPKPEAPKPQKKKKEEAHEAADRHTVL